MKPLLTLCMIVKDEAHTIARTLRSAKPYVDRWCILDTGSTDGTPEEVRDWMADVPGVLWSEPFVDFATTRNALLSEATEARDCGEFLLLLDADDILEGGEALRAFLQDAMPLSGETLRGATSVNPAVAEEAFYLQMQQGSCVWDSARVVRADVGWRYVGAVHEVLCHPDRPAPSIRIPGVTIRHDPPPVSRERSMARWERDLALLRKDIDADPENARAVYYYASTWRRLGDFSAAAFWYERRLRLGGFWQERYDAAFELARLMLPDTSAFVARMLDAHAIDPRRAEPLVDLARHYLIANAFGPAFTFARRAFDLSQHVPDGALFLNADVYAWEAADVLARAAYYVGEYDVGERAARLAVERGPEHLREHHERNLRFYTERKR